MLFFFFFNDTATTEIYTLSLHDALPIWRREGRAAAVRLGACPDSLPAGAAVGAHDAARGPAKRSLAHAVTAGDEIEEPTAGGGLVSIAVRGRGQTSV